MTSAVRMGLWSAIAVATLVIALVAWWPRRAVPGASPIVTVLVNGETSIDVAPGTPLIFEVTLRGPRRDRVVVGSSWRPWQTLIRLEDNQGRSLPWRLAAHGQPKAISVSLAGQYPTLSTNVTAVADLQWQSSEYTMSLAVAPDETQQLSGTTGVRALVETPWWTGSSWRGKVTSPSVTVRVPSDAGSRPDLNLARLLGSADYFLLRHEYERAYAASEQLTRSAPDLVIGKIFHGDALAGLQRRDEALAAYRSALALRGVSYEEPTLLLDRIARLSRRSQ